MKGEIKNLNILLTSAGRRGYLVGYFKEELKGKGKIFAANSSPISTALQLADESVITPLIYDKNYIPFLVNYCIEKEIDTIIPLFDVDLYVLACNRELFSQIGVNIIVSEKDVIEKCNDKWQTHQFLTNNGFNSPRTWISIEDVKKQIQDKKLKYPLIIKPRWGMGSISVYEAENEEELEVFYKKVRRDIFKTYLKYESVQDIDKSVLFQEKLNGQEYGVDVINDLNGNHITTVIKKKIAMRSGETDCAQTVYNEELSELGKKLGQRLAHIANLDVDVFVDNENIYVLEMNARFGGGYPFSHISGINLPKAIISWERGIEPNENCFNSKENILAQKEINLRKIKSVENIVYKEALLKGAETLSPTLFEQGVDVEKWVEKVLQFGTIIIEQDAKENFQGVIAFYLNDFIDYTAFITIIAVDEKFRCKGIGKKLLLQAENTAKQKLMKKIRLSVKDENINAVQFYKKNGYIFEKRENDKAFFMIKNL